MKHPETIKRGYFRAKRVAFGAFCLFLSVSGSIPAIAGPDEELKNLRKALTASSERQEEISARLQLLSSEIRALKEKSVRVAGRLIKIDRKMIYTEERLVDIRTVEQQTINTMAKQNKGLANTLSALLQLSRQPEGSLIGSPENLIDNLRTATLLKAAVKALKKDADALSDQLDTLATLRDQFLAEQKNLGDLRTSRLSEEETLKSLLKSKNITQASLSSLNVKEAQAQRKLSEDARDLVALINSLEKNKQVRLLEERRRLEKEIARQETLRRAENKRAAEEARHRALQNAQEREEKNAQIAAIPKPLPSRKPQKVEKTTRNSTLNARKSISKAKGTLALPVGGKIISKYSAAREVGKRNGIVIETRGNAAVVSPYDGQIAFAGPFRHYGLLLIIDHGEGYHTLLAGMGSIEGTVGQLLLAGEPVGQMKSGNNDKPTLYMELRVKGSPVNPIPWLAVGYRKVSG